VVDFEAFRAELDRALGRSERSKAGRPSGAECRIQDRLTFMRCLSPDVTLSPGLGDKVPDCSTIGRFC